MRGLLLVAVLAFSSAAHGDTCIITGKPWTALSENRQWRLIATPVSGRTDAFTRAELYRMHAGRWRRHARWRFVNEYGPMSRIVANDGTVVTLDNECHYGVGRDVVVIYTPDGSLVRSLALADLLVPEDVAVLDRTVSSIHWSDVHRLEEGAGQLVLRVKGPPRTIELPLSLTTGELLVPKRRRFYVPEFDLVVTVVPDAGEDLGALTCDGGFETSGAELLSRAATMETPPFPAVAQKARVEGTVVLDLTVDDTGAVTHVVIRKPLPFGLSAAAEAAARRWRFQPSERTLCGRIAVRFARVMRLPPAID